MTFSTITSSDELWNKTRDYAFACSWRAGKYMAKLMNKNAFSEWERVIVAMDDDGTICGFCTVVKEDCIPNSKYFPNIGYVFVDEAYRGHRISQKMLRYASEYVKQIGFDKVYLVSDHENLYEKYGFIVVDRVIAPWGEEEKIYEQKLN